jgi:hypothetical protein
MHYDIFQDLSPVMCSDAFNKISYNGITKEFILICKTFEYIQQIVDFVDGPNDRNQTLSGVNFLFDYFWNIISRWDPDCCMPILEIKSRLIACYSMIKLILSLIRQNFQQFRRKCNSFDCSIAIESVRNLA